MIKVSSIDELYFAGQFAGARRVDGTAAAIVEDIDMTRRAAGLSEASREHDARVLPILDPAATRPTG